MAKLVPGKNGKGLMNRFEPGESGNPKGGPKKWVSKLKSEGYKKSEIIDALFVLLSMTKWELQRVPNNPKSTILETTIAKALLEGDKKKSLWNIELVLDRVIGKPKETIETPDIKDVKITLNLGT